jgi:hypothetical protein
LRYAARSYSGVVNHAPSRSPQDAKDSIVISGWLFLGLSALLCIGVFLNGLRFARMERNPLAGKKMFRLPVEGSDMPIATIRRIGQLQMIFAPFFFIFVVALTFGLLGPIEGIETIRSR